MSLWLAGLELLAYMPTADSSRLHVYEIISRYLATDESFCDRSIVNYFSMKFFGFNGFK